jgi:CDP-diacylglycerol---serine O-phosphatidyltransferase
MFELFYYSANLPNTEIYLNFVFLLTQFVSPMKHIPNFITSLNLAAGFTAVIFAATGETVTASWLILAAMVFDFLDGFSARLLKAYSAIGKELDSLADVVSFGVAPGIIIYNLLSNSFSAGAPAEINADSLNTILIIAISAVMPVCAALRLAIFNIDETQAKTFRGLPTPANALAVITVVISSRYSDSAPVTSFAGSTVLLIIFTVILSLLMVSRIPLLSLKVSDLKFKGNEGRYIMIGLILIAYAIFGIASVPLIIPLYILSSLIALLF